MALIRDLKNKQLERPSLHKEIGASYSCFEKDGRTLVQIDSYGSNERTIPGKVSQSLQFDEASARIIFDIFKREFGFL